MSAGPREIVTPFRPIPLAVPEGMSPNEFFNSAENLNDFAHNNGLLRRDHCVKDARYAHSIRWQPAFKQLVYRNDEGRLIVTISRNSIGNAITELLGVLVRRVPDAEAYARGEPALMEKLFEARRRLARHSKSNAWRPVPETCTTVGAPAQFGFCEFNPKSASVLYGATHCSSSTRSLRLTR